MQFYATHFAGRAIDKHQLLARNVMKSFRKFISEQSQAKQLIRRMANLNATPADEVIISEASGVQYLDESNGKWIKGDFEDEIRVDRNTHMRSGEKHAHIHDRNGNELRAITHDAKPSHGSKPYKLTKKQASALRKEGFPIPPNRIVEAVLIRTGLFEIHG